MRVAIGFEVMLVFGGALEIKLPGIPLASFGHGVNAPVEVDSEFCVAEPFGALVALERFDGGFEFGYGLGAAEGVQGWGEAADND